MKPERPIETAFERAKVLGWEVGDRARRNNLFSLVRPEE